MHFYVFSTIFTALFFPYITNEGTAQNLILSVRSSLFALFLIERHRSQNSGPLKSEERLIDFKEGCAQLWFSQVTNLLGSGKFDLFATLNRQLTLCPGFPTFPLYLTVYEMGYEIVLIVFVILRKKKFSQKSLIEAKNILCVYVAIYSIQCS